MTPTTVRYILHRFCCSSHSPLVFNISDSHWKCAFFGQYNVRRTFSEQCMILSLTHSQLALQWHGGIDALAQCRHTLLHRTHLHVDQAAAGVALGRPRFPVFRRGHPAFLHPLELDCRANTNTREVIMTAQIAITGFLSGNCIHRRPLGFV